MKLTIDRTNWLRGEGVQESYLLRATDGKRCCIGFLAQACGIPDSKLSDTRSLYKLALDSGTKLHINDSFLSEFDPRIEDAYLINDTEVYEEKAREEKIAGLLGQLGVTVTFIN